MTNEQSKSQNHVLEDLHAILESRKLAATDGSYVASLYAAGLNKILEKVGEEATEVIIAAKDLQTGGDRKALVHETADLWFHTLVMLSSQDLSVRDVLEELARRFDTSGLKEKASRGNN